jgi:hypothetical protein
MAMQVLATALCRRVFGNTLLCRMATLSRSYLTF